MNVLIFAPHPDDELLGCGGTIAKHVQKGDNVFVCVVTEVGEPILPDIIADETRAQQQIAHKILGVKEVSFLGFATSMLEDTPRYVLNKAIDDEVMRIKPQVIYMPHFGDLQKDHTLVSDAIMVAIRPRGKEFIREVYAYETVSETEWNYPHVSKIYIPQRFVDITGTLEIKLKALAVMKRQIKEFPDTRSLEAIEALAKLRGATVGVKAAEAYSVIKVID